MIAQYVKEDQSELVIQTLKTVKVQLFHGIYFAGMYMTLLRIRIKSGKKLEKTAASAVGQNIMNF